MSGARFVKTTRIAFDFGVINDVINSYNQFVKIMPDASFK